MSVNRSQLERALRDLFGDKGVQFFAGMIGRNYNSFRRSINDSHSAPYQYVALTCDLLYRLRGLDLVPTEVLKRAEQELPLWPGDLSLDRMVDLMSSLLGPGYAEALSSQVYRPTRSIERSMRMPGCLAYPHLRNIAFLLQLIEGETGECPSCILRSRSSFSYKKQVGAQHDG